MHFPALYFLSLLRNCGNVCVKIDHELDVRLSTGSLMPWKHMGF